MQPLTIDWDTDAVKTVTADVTRRLREEIICCRLKPGARLKFEQLRSDFGASFTTLREALMSLVADGLVLMEGRRGFQVAPVSLSELNDLTETRVLIESELLRKSIENGDEEWEVRIVTALKELAHVEKDFDMKSEDNTPWRKAHKGFHRALVSASGSPVLFNMGRILFDRTERYRSLSATFRPAPRNKTDEHRSLMMAAINRETKTALTLMESHIRRTSENVAEFAADILA